jgi:RNA polymerase sigma-70 factor (ECF subfamily)
MWCTARGEFPSPATRQLMAVNPRPANSARGGRVEAGAAASMLAAERELVSAVLRKDRKAVAEFVAGHVDSVYAYVTHRLAPRVERVDDLVHDVFVAALGSLQTFRGTSPLRHWLLGIARHKVEDFYRQQLREPDAIAAPGEPEEPAAGEPIEEQIDRARAAEKTQRIMQLLPAAYSTVLLWRYWESRSVRDIAEATGRTEKAVERLLARARTRFRELWSGDRHD